MAVQTFTQSESTPSRRLFFIFCVDETDGITPETGEAGGQPQISVNGSSFSNTEALLLAIGNGAYSVALSITELATLGKIIVRYKSGNTAEFEDVGFIQPTGEVSNDDIKAQLTKLQQKINWIEHLMQRGQASAAMDGDFSIL